MQVKDYHVNFVVLLEYMLPIEQIVHLSMFHVDEVVQHMNPPMSITKTKTNEDEMNKR